MPFTKSPEKKSESQNSKSKQQGKNKKKQSGKNSPKSIQGVNSQIPKSSAPKNKKKDVMKKIQTLFKN